MRYILTILFCTGLLAVAPRLGAATKAEERAFKAAALSLESKIYNQAEQGFALFIESYPDSTNKVSAVLHQAQARFFQTNYAGTLELLQKGAPEAGALSHEYQYWIAQTYFKNGDYRAAADAFSLLGKNYPDSSHALEGSYYEALAESKLDNGSRVIELLNAPDGKFQLVTRAQPNSAFTVEGNLLLAEALLKQRLFDEAEKVVTKIDESNLAPEAKWRRTDLICRIQLASGRAVEALETTTNLLTLATLTAKSRLYAETVFLRGDILQKLNRLSEAVEVLEQNLGKGSTNVPVEIRRRSFFKLLDLNLAKGDVTNSIARLENFIAQYPSDTSIDLAFLTLGELRLKQFVSMGTNPTNAGTAPDFFDVALTNFNLVITNFPQSAHLGKAYLDRGWCFWLKENYANAESDFSQAVTLLPISEEKAVARFKLADSQFKQTNYAAAVTNYQLLIENHRALERVTNSLFEAALHQIVRAGLELKNEEIANDAMQKLFDWFPRGTLGDRTLLLVGQNFRREGTPGKTRELFSKYMKHLPDSPREAEIKLFLAQTYVQEQDWTNALAALDQWVTNYAAHPLLAQGEFSRARAFDKAGQSTNAFALMTNFISRFPSNELASLAQNWIADFYWNQQDYRSAEKSYQELYQKFKPSRELAYQARLMAGRSAFGRLDYAEAAKYFKSLVTDLITLGDKSTNGMGTLTDEAWFALGDTLFQDFLSNTNEALMGEAITAFSRITKDSTNAMAQLAWGRIGDCYFQLAAQDPAQYVKAAQFFSNVVYSIHAKADARSRAQVCLGNVCLKQAEKSGAEKGPLVEQAFNHFWNVVTEANLLDGETFDPKWTYEAGLAAVKICESSERWEQALKIYELLAKRLPPLRPAFEKKMAVARMNLVTAGN